MEILQVANGYIVKDTGLTYVFPTLEAACDHLLLRYERLGKTLLGKSHGFVTITRPMKDAEKNCGTIHDPFAPSGLITG